MEKLIVRLAPKVERKLISILNYLETNWSEKEAIDFLQKFINKSEQVARFPLSSTPSRIIRGSFMAVVTRHVSFIYFIRKNEIQIAHIIDNRRGPENRLKEKAGVFQYQYRIHPQIKFQSSTHQYS